MKQLVRRVLMFQALKGFFITLWYVDPALALVEKFNIVPYSYIWQLINPFAGTNNSAYVVFLLIFDSLFAILYSQFCGAKTYIAWQATDLHWFSGFYQNVTITWFAPLLTFAKGWYFIPLMLFS